MCPCSLRTDDVPVAQVGRLAPDEKPQDEVLDLVAIAVTGTVEGMFDPLLKTPALRIDVRTPTTVVREEAAHAQTQ